MTVDVKVNVLERRISQLFKVTFFSEKLEASTDPFLYRENASNMSLWPPARGSGSSRTVACVQTGRFHGYWSSWWLFQLWAVFSEHRRTEHWRGSPESDQISPGLKNGSLAHSLSTSSAQLSLGNLQGWGIHPFPAAASVLPSQEMQHQVIGFLLFQIYFQV